MSNRVFTPVDIEPLGEAFFATLRQKVDSFVLSNSMRYTKTTMSVFARAGELFKRLKQWIKPHRAQSIAIIAISYSPRMTRRVF